MRQETINVYTFEELPTIEARDAARNWWRGLNDLHWCDESRESIQAFVDHFGASLKSWNIGPHAPLDYDVQYFNSHFRGLKLKDFDRNHMPTGFCLDCDLWITFYDEFKSTGCASKAFEAAIEAGFKAWRSDMESQLEDDYIDEHLIINGYEFTENGEFF